ncbi:MAG: hypothetical protein HQK97_07340 [Nitrospirae bacterium]|nr:hypothetical protein [Nitrospirota bacterium]
MAYHMSMVSSFANHMGFPPLNPQCAWQPLSYHYLVDFHSAVLHISGLPLYLSVEIPQILFSFALAGLVCHFYKTILEEEGKALFAAMFFVGGHIGFFNLLFAAVGFPAAVTTFDGSSWAGIKEQMLFSFMNFLNITINFFQPQRPFLFGFPMSLIILSSLYDTLVKHDEINYWRLMTVSLLTGLLPLFHVHSFMVVAPVVCVSAFYLCPDRRRTASALLPVLLGVIQIWLILSGPKGANYSGFDVHTLGGGLREMMVLNSALIARILFWIRAAGAPLILGTAAAYLYFRQNRDFSCISGSKNIFLMVFLIVNCSYFIIINFYRFTPNWGDSNKFFLYLSLCMSIFMGSIAWGIFNSGGVATKSAVIATIMAAGVLPQAVEHYAIFFTKPSGVLYTGCDVKAAQWIKANTAANAVFLTDNGIVHFVAPLTGRAVVDGAYNRETGYANPERENEIKKIFSTAEAWLIKKYNIDFIVVSRYERAAFAVNDDALKRYKKVYDEQCHGENYNEHYKVYDTR